MGRVERETGNVIVDGNPPGQHGGQINLAFGFVYVLDHDRHSPVLSKGSGLGVNFRPGEAGPSGTIERVWASQQRA
jgi:hypothetical protein